MNRSRRGLNWKFAGSGVSFSGVVRCRAARTLSKIRRLGSRQPPPRHVQIRHPAADLEPVVFFASSRYCTVAHPKIGLIIKKECSIFARTFGFVRLRARSSSVSDRCALVCTKPLALGACCRITSRYPLCRPSRASGHLLCIQADFVCRPRKMMLNDFLRVKTLALTVLGVKLRGYKRASTTSELLPYPVT